MYRRILHCDMNNFFASVELLDRPDLLGKLVAVCGNPKERHGIILAKSPEAKALGVKTGETIQQAEAKCNGNLYLLAAHYDKYLKYSNLAKQIYLSYTDQVESFGLDECWLDITHSEKLFGSPEQIAREIIMRIKQELGLTISVGYSYNKIFAKLASDLADNASLLTISPFHYREQVWPLDIANLLGVGRHTRKLLAKYEINTIGDYAKADAKFLESLLGINGLKLWYFANGRDMSQVHSYAQAIPIKSIGNGMTCVRDIVHLTELEAVLLNLAEQVQARLAKHDYLARVLQLNVRYQDFNHKQIQVPLAYPAASARYFVDNILPLVYKCDLLFAPIRALSLRASNLTTRQAQQIDWSDDYVRFERNRRLDLTLQEIRSTYGQSAANYAVQVKYNDLFPKMKENSVTSSFTYVD